MLMWVTHHQITAREAIREEATQLLQLAAFSFACDIA